MNKQKDHDETGLMVEYEKEGKVIRQGVEEYCNTCRRDKQMYAFKVIGGSDMNGIDDIVALIDDVATGNL